MSIFEDGIAWSLGYGSVPKYWISVRHHTRMTRSDLATAKSKPILDTARPKNSRLVAPENRDAFHELTSNCEMFDIGAALKVLSVEHYEMRKHLLFSL